MSRKPSIYLGPFWWPVIKKRDLEPFVISIGVIIVLPSWRPRWVYTYYYGISRTHHDSLVIIETKRTNSAGELRSWIRRGRGLAIGELGGKTLAKEAECQAQPRLPINQGIKVDSSPPRMHVPLAFVGSETVSVVSRNGACIYNQDGGGQRPHKQRT